MSTTHDPTFEKRFGDLIERVLDMEAGPHSTWADSPAARRIASGEGDVRRLRRPPMRLLALAAVLVIGAAAAVAGSMSDTTRTPLPTLHTVANPSVAPVTTGWIAYESDGAIFLADEGGRSHMVVTAAAGGASCPHFMPDGMLVYQQALEVSPEGPVGLVFTAIDADGNPSGEARVLNVDGFASNQCVAWSPDGARFAHLAQIGQDVRLVVEHLDGAQWALPATGFQFGVFGWSPDSSRIAIVTNSDDITGASDLMVVTPDGAPENGMSLVMPGGHTEFVQWSPDGTRIAVAETEREIAVGRQGDSTIVDVAHFVGVLKADGSFTEPQVIDYAARPSGDRLDDAWSLFAGPIWSPDSSRVAWVRSGRLYVTDATAIEPKAVELKLDRRAFALEAREWSADAQRILMTAIDTPFVDRGVQVSTIVVDVEGRAAPTWILPWHRGLWRNLDWQTSNAGDALDLSGLAPFVRESLPSPTPSPTPTVPPRPVPAT